MAVDKIISKSLPYSDIDTLYFAEEGTTYDPNVDTLEGWISLGRISTDGWSEASPAGDTEVLYVDGNVAADTSQGERTDTYSATLMQTKSLHVRQLLRGQTLTVAGTGYGTSVGKGLGKKYAFLIFRKEGTARHIKYIASGTIAQSGDVSRNQSDLIGYPFTITALLYGNNETAVIEYDIDESTLNNIYVTASIFPANGGTITPEGATLVARGGTLSLTAEAATGYEISDWCIDGIYIGVKTPSYEFTDIEESHNVQVMFRPAQPEEPEEPEGT